MRSLLHNQKTQHLSVETTPLPSPSPTQYIIKTHATAFTTGELSWPRPDELNISTPGVEFVGEVVKSPASDSKFPPGSEVYGRVQYPQPGAAREYTLSDDDELALRPKNLSVNEAVTIPVSALTAWQALFEEFKLAPLDLTSSTTGINRLDGRGNGQDKRILITNASGGVGIWAVQLSKLAGLYVIGTAGPQNLDFVRSLGADEVLDYRSTNIATWARESPSTRSVDIVLDCIGGSSLEQAWHAVKPGGLILTIVPPPVAEGEGWKWTLDRPAGVDESVAGRFFIMHPSGTQLAEITTLAEQGKVRAVVDSVYRLDEYEKAFERLASGRARGKIVMRLDDEE